MSKRVGKPGLASRPGFSFLWSLGVAAAVLWLTFALALTSIRSKSPTFDEQGFITRGLAYLRGANQSMRVGHPLGLNALNAALLTFDQTVQLPTDHPSWNQTNFHRPSELFMWETGNDVARVMFLARLPTIWLGLLLAAVTARWAWAMSRRREAGLLALMLLAFDPNILAHMRLATTDLGLAAGVVVAGFTLWQFLKRPSWGRAIVAGMGLGLLQNTKFTAGLFVPLLGLVIIVALLRSLASRSSVRPILLPLLLAYPTAAFLTLWAAYGFQVGTLPPNLPTWPQLSGLTLPLSHHVAQLLDIGGRLQKTTPAFLLGSYSDSGWWYYFPVAFAFKTPLPTLIFLVGGMGYALVRWRRRHTAPRLTLVDGAALLLPAGGYFAFALTTDINLGYRHLLPVLPFLFVFTAVVLSPLLTRLWWGPGLLVGWLFLNALFIYPHFLAYFNRLGGTADQGWRYLVDSNIDWGQDLAGLKAWMDENGVERVWLSYFGEARPDYYGINYVGLDSFPPRLMNGATRPFYPPDPAPGIYAISATNLQGVHFAHHDQFAWFRPREPIAKIGYSIFLYEVPARGETAHLALSGVQLDEILPADMARLGTNDVVPHWFDASQSFLYPAWSSPTAAVWLAVAPTVPVHAHLQPIWAQAFAPVVTTAAYTLYQARPDARQQWLDLAAAEPIPAVYADKMIYLLGASEVEGDMGTSDDRITLLTAWQQASSPQPVKIFVHYTGVDGQIVAQWDGLGAAWEGWRPGDLLLQVHELQLPAETLSGRYDLLFGLYHPETGRRWQFQDDGGEWDDKRWLRQDRLP